ncbi:TMAO reductase system periplasmic protein TorT [uncultured Marivita sp.]|uniref:TMAO reductase system periplasmic protein TorT n=1 Tax=uncultured Marivita sp. TaxID=888080 RepID=UPI0026332686|nr:TMAO reductase system periplasmic protein TorT [uncultured Marivita sp.]
MRCIPQQYGAEFRCTIIAIVLCAVGLSGDAQAEENRHFCVLVPHFKDDYWLSVGFGIEHEAARQKVHLSFYEAGGYRALAEQVGQLDDCARAGVDGILIGTVTSDHPDMTTAISRASNAVPVFALVNELHADGLAGQIGVDWRNMGYEVGAFLSRRHPKAAEAKTAVLLNGPAEAGWTAPLEDGLRQALAKSSVEIVDVLRADTGVRAQLDLVETALTRRAGVDYLIGSAPAIEAALGMTAAGNAMEQPLLVSTYVTPSILRGLKSGRVIAAPFDDPVQQGAMAIEHAVAAIDDGTSFDWVGPPIRLVEAGDEDLNKITFSPANFFPLIQ